MTHQTHVQQSKLSFEGGPLDGYVESTVTPLNEMPEVLGILVSPGIVQMLTTQRLECEKPATSLAFYQQSNAEDSHYRFVGATSPAELEFNDQSFRA